jgi:SAM-dependent methyltransferase
METNGTIEAMVEEETREFQQAVEEWRRERALGGGNAIIVEAGGGFNRQKENMDSDTSKKRPAHEHYESHLGVFYSWMSGNFSTAVEEGRAFFSSHDIRPANHNDIALDLGCGHGIFSVPLATLGYQVKAVDFSQRLLDELQSQSTGLDIQTYCCDIRNFECFASSNSLNLITCMTDTISHLESQNEIHSFLEKCYTSLQSGGKLVISFRDYSIPLYGVDRFIPVKSDENRILTCILDFSDTHVTVTDQLYERDGTTGWTQKISSYDKVRVTEESISGAIKSIGFTILTITTIRRMIYIIAEKPLS